MVIKTFGAIICGASVLAVSQPMKANAATVQRAIRGTWFLKVPADPLLHTKSYVQETKNYAHSIKIKAGNSKVFVIKGRHPATNTYKTKFRYKGGKFHTVTVNVAGQGDTQGLISTHLKINGKRNMYYWVNHRMETSLMYLLTSDRLNITSCEDISNTNIFYPLIN